MLLLLLLVVPIVPRHFNICDGLLLCLRRCSRLSGLQAPLALAPIVLDCDFGGVELCGLAENRFVFSNSRANAFNEGVVYDADRGLGECAAEGNGVAIGHMGCVWCVVFPVGWFFVIYF